MVQWNKSIWHFHVMSHDLLTFFLYSTLMKKDLSYISYALGRHPFTIYSFWANLKVCHISTQIFLFFFYQYINVFKTNMLVYFLPNETKHINDHACILGQKSKDKNGCGDKRKPIMFPWPRYTKPSRINLGGWKR